jgi:hypothetical protein
MGVLTGRGAIDEMFRRALGSLVEAAQAADAYFASGMFELEEIGPNQTRVRIHEPFPDEIAYLIRYGVHDARSALDYLAWRLVEVGGGSPGRSTQFPIQAESGGYGPKVRASLRGARAEHIDFVRDLKAFRGGDDRFYELSEIDNSYKHRMIAPVLVEPGGSVMTFHDRSGNALIPPFHFGGRSEVYRPLSDGTVITSERFDDPDVPVVTNVQMALEAGIRAGDLPYAVSVGRIGTIVSEIPGIVEPLVADVA